MHMQSSMLTFVLLKMCLHTHSNVSAGSRLPKKMSDKMVTKTDIHILCTSQLSISALDMEDGLKITADQV